MSKASLILSVIIGLLTTLVACAETHDGGAKTDTAAGGQAIDATLFPDDSKVRTDAALVIKDGQVVYENYGRGYDQNTKHLSWSMAKTVAGILIGIADDKGLLSLEDRVVDYLPNFKGHSDTTVLDLLQMSSGLNFLEAYSKSNVSSMLYVASQDGGTANYVLKLDRRQDLEPGNHFYYSSGDTNLLMAILKIALQGNEHYAYDTFPWDVFFTPLFGAAAQDISFEQDAAGTFVGSSYIYMSTLQYAELGKLLNARGVARAGAILGSKDTRGEDARIIPARYFELMTQVAPGVHAAAAYGTSPTRAYSMQITTNQAIERPDYSLPPEYPHMPVDALIAIGHQGQVLLASPDEDLVVLRLATDKRAKKNPFDRQAFFRSVHDYLNESASPIEAAIDGAYENAYGPEYDALLAAISEQKEVDTERATDVYDNAGTKAGTFKLVTAIAAKEICSCHYVVGRDIRTCKKDLRATFPAILPSPKVVTTSLEQGGIRATYLGAKESLAIYRGKTLGCSISQ